MLFISMIWRKKQQNFFCGLSSTCKAFVHFFYYVYIWTQSTFKFKTSKQDSDVLIPFHGWVNSLSKLMRAFVLHPFWVSNNNFQYFFLQRCSCSLDWSLISYPFQSHIGPLRVKLFEIQMNQKFLGKSKERGGVSTKVIWWIFLLLFQLFFCLLWCQIADAFEQKFFPKGNWSVWSLKIYRYLLFRKQQAFNEKVKESRFFQK